MLSAEYRLTKKKDFQRIYKGGKTLNTALFRIKTHPNGQQKSRSGFVISNKTIRKAVWRNTAKRKIRAAMRELYPHIRSGYDMIIVAQPQVSSANYGDILEDLRKAFTRIGFIEQDEKSELSSKK